MTDRWNLHHAWKRGAALFAAGLVLLLVWGVLHPALAETHTMPQSDRSVLAAEKDEEHYDDIPFGTVSDSVLNMQLRLQKLNYFNNGLKLNPRVYDADTLTALQNFCRNNSVTFVGETATASIQRILFSDSAKANDAKRSLKEYFTSTVQMGSAEIPMFFIWIVSALIVGLIIFLIIWFFVPSKDKEKKRQDTMPQEPPRLWRKVYETPNSVGVAAAEMLAGEKNAISFQISYEGQMRNESIPCRTAITIGRENTQLLLDSQDGSVSRNHCELAFRGSVLILTDHSSNGTGVNGKRIHNSDCRILSGDELTVGNHKIRVMF